MAQELDLIFETLRDIKKANTTNSESVERLLVSVANKLEVIDRNSTSTDFIKAVLTEITKETENRHQITLQKLSDIEKALKAIFNGQDEHVKTTELKELFDVFSTNMNSVYSEIRQQKAVISGIENKISGISSNKSDKEDILRTISLLRNDFENLNQSYKYTIDSVSTDLKSIINGIIKTDQTAANQELKEQIDIMQKAISDIYDYLSGLSNRDAKLELILSGLATGESLKITQGIVDSLVEKTENISQKLAMVATNDDVQDILSETEGLKNRLDETVTKNLFASVVEASNKIVEQTDELKQQLATITGNLENLPDTSFLETTVQKLYEQITFINDGIEKFDSRNTLGDIVNIINNLSTELKTCKNITTDLNDVVNESVLKSLNNISFDNEAYGIKEHISELIRKLPQKEDIEKVLASYDATGQSIDEILNTSDRILEKIDKLPTHDDIESLSNNQLSIVENLQTSANKTDMSEISKKIDNIENEIKSVNFDKEFDSIYDKTSSIENWLTNSKLKENTESLIEKIENKPDKEDLLKILNTMETIINGVEELSNNTDAKKVRHTLTDVYQILEDLKNDFISTAEMHNDSVIVNLSELQQSVDNIVTGDEFNNFVEEMKNFLDSLTTHIEKTESEYSAIVDYQQAIINKVETLNTESINASLDLANEKLDEVKTNVSSIQDWLTNSRIKENTEELLAQVKDKPDREDILKVLKVVETIVGDLSEISQKDNSQTVNDTINEVCNKIENLKTEFIETSEMQNDAVVEHLSELQASVENIVNGDEFNTFTDEVKSFLEQIVSNTDKINSDYIAIKEYQVAIIDKLDTIDIQTIKDIVENRSTVVEDTLTNISEYLTTVNKIDSTEIKQSVNEIKEFLEARKSSFDEFEISSQETIEILENYLSEVKRIIDLSDFAVAENVKNKLIKIEEDLLLYQGQNENALTDIIAKLNEYQNFAKTLDEPYSNQDLKASMREISEIKDMITTLAETYKSLKYDEESREKEIADFVTNNLDGLSNNLEELTESIDSQLQQGFAYNAALIEEKTTSLLNFIQDLRHNNFQNIDLYERLTVTDNKLMDFKQELELINTDVISTINSKSDRLLEEIEPIRKMLDSMLKSTDFSKHIEQDLSELHTSISSEITDNAIPQATLSRLDYTYEQLTNDLSSMETNIKSFVMSDIDAVLRKVDELQDTVTGTLEQLVPPEAESMQEFKEFITQLEDFKNSQHDMILAASEDIKNKMQEQHEELKSILTVSLNNKKIISAIEDLKRNILGKASAIQELQEQNITESQLSDAEDSDNITEENDDDSDTDIETVSFSDLQRQQDDISLQTRQLLIEVRSDYNKFVEIIKGLSGENAEIKNVLKTIQEKMNNIVIQKVATKNDIDAKAQVDNSETGDAITDSLPAIDNDTNKDVILGEGNFNFIQALDCFKSDVQHIHKDVESVLSTTECQKTISSINGEIDAEDFAEVSKKVNTILRRINSGEWLDEIKNYITDGKIGTTLDLILGKLDILALTDSCEWVQDVKMLVNKLKEGELSSTLDPQIGSMIALLNDKIDILAESDDYELFEELRDILSHSQFEQNIETTDLLNLINKKLDVLANADEDFDLEELKEKLTSIESKINEITTTESTDNSEFVDDIMYTLLNVEDKVDKLSIEAGTEIIDDIKQIIENLNEKIGDFSKFGGLSGADDVKERLALIESKIDIIASEDSETWVDEVKERLDILDAKVDIVASTDSYNDLEDIRLSLENVEEQVAAVRQYSSSDVTITAILEVINHKIDSLCKNGNEFSQKEFRDVKDLIMAQMDYIDSLENNQKTEAVRKCLKELTVEVNNLNSVQNSKQIQKTLKDMKESIMTAVVAVFEQISFVEESEDIKDFVEEKTDEINQNLALVTDQLKQITNNTEDSANYTYSMQDIESDLAKLRLALKDIQNSDQVKQAENLSSLLDNIHQIGSSVQELQNALSKDELLGLQLNFERVNSDIESLTMMSKHLIMTSGETYNSLNNNLEIFGRTITEQITSKVDRVTKLLEKSNASDTVMRQALIYVGEWIDSASDSMNKISTNSEEILEVKTVIESLKKTLPEQTNILNSLEEKFDEQQERLAFFEKQISKLSGIEDKFEEQQERIDRLEMTIEKILSAVEDIDDTKVTRKIDKIDKQIAKLSINIEKLASYVD